MGVFQRTVLIIMGAIGATVLALMVAAPFAFPYGSFTHLDGSPSVLDHDWSPYGPMGLVYALGDILCHQEQLRTFMLNGSEMPVCIRDTGLLIGLTAGLLSGARFDRLLTDRRCLWAGAGLLMLTLAEWCFESATSVDLPEIRFILAILSGLGAAMIVGHLLYGISPGPEAL
jgi:uncharacterized membrane protein